MCTFQMLLPVESYPHCLASFLVVKPHMSKDHSLSLKFTLVICSSKGLGKPLPCKVEALTSTCASSGDGHLLLLSINACSVITSEKTVWRLLSPVRSHSFLEESVQISFEILKARFIYTASKGPPWAL